MVIFKGHRYYLTRMDLGLNMVPVIMKSIIQKAMSEYTGDKYVNESIASAACIQHHLADYGLTCKEAKWLKKKNKKNNSAQVLGLCVWGSTTPSTGGDILEVSKLITRHVVFSLCGKTLGYLPVSRWLRVVTAFINAKRQQSQLVGMMR